MQDDQAYSESWHSQNSLFKHFRRCLSIFSHIDAYSATLKGAQIVRRGAASWPFLEIEKKCPDFGKKFPDCVHLCFNIQSGILGILQYSERFHNCIPTNIQSPVIFTKSYEYSEL